MNIEIVLVRNKNFIFRSLQANLKELDHCYNDYKQHECPLPGTMRYNQNHKEAPHKVNENLHYPQISSQSIVFEVDMVGFQSKIMTYRAALRQSQVGFLILVLIFV